MAQVNSLPVTCGLCGSPSDQGVSPAAVQDSRQPPDLDTRPAEPVRSTIQYWMQCCPECGYCASDISTIHESAAELIATDDYQRRLLDSSLPETTRRFLCHALILEQVKQYADAGWTALHAAWAADDAADPLAAQSARKLALQYWQHGKRHGQAFGDLAEEFILAADVGRRAGQFEEALLTVNEGLEVESLPRFLERVLRFEKTLISRRDMARHDLGEIP
jgi:hypothetical protein